MNPLTPYKVDRTRIVFLNIDGLFSRMDQYCRKWTDWFDKRSVAALNHVLLETNAAIVFSTPWMQWNSFEKLSKTMKQNGVIGEVIGHTPAVPTVRRHVAVGHWLKQFKDKYKVQSYIIMDSDPSCDQPPHKGRGFVIEPEMEKQQFWVPRAINILRTGRATPQKIIIAPR